MLGIFILHFFQFDLKRAMIQLSQLDVITKTNNVRDMSRFTIVDVKEFPNVL